jgi:hypothetical protein
MHLPPGVVRGACSLDDQKAMVAADESLSGVVVVVGRDDVSAGRVEHCLEELEVDPQVISTVAAAAFTEDLNGGFAEVPDCSTLSVDLSGEQLVGRRLC